MSRVAAAQTRMVAYLPGLRTILQRLRATASTPSSLTATLLTSSPPTTTHPTLTPSPLADALYDSDLVVSRLHPQFPLPGSSGPTPCPAPFQPLPTSTVASSVDTTANMEGLSEATLALLSSEASLTPSPSSPSHDTVECVVQECPRSLHSGFLQLFPGVSVQDGQLSVITLSEQTENDMTGWSPKVEEEREQLLEHFVASAKEIYARLTAAGYWCDFIDPSSGRAFYSAYSHETLFETDDRFRHLGFDILDLGCCKCITHHLWGSHTFVGTIFTNAPSDSPAIHSIVLLLH